MIEAVQHVREKFACRDCEKVSQAPAPFHPLPRGFLGPSLIMEPDAVWPERSMSIWEE